MTLTENFAMLPAAAVSGFYLAHPEAMYFAVGKIGDDQAADFARRDGVVGASRPDSRPRAQYYAARAKRAALSFASASRSAVRNPSSTTGW